MQRIGIRMTLFSVILATCMQITLANDYENHWAKEAIDKWSGYGIVNGYETGEFKPNNPITRAELASMLDRIFKFKPSTKPSIYFDIIVAPDKWYVDSVNKVMELNLMYIKGGFFEPNALVTREEAAYAINKAYAFTMLENNKEFNDETSISSWAKESVQTLVSNGFINGTPNGEFKPQSTITRAEIVTILNNITSNLITKEGTYTESMSGNIVVNSSDIILKDVTIDGNLYITQGVEKIILDNVVVTDTIYVNGGDIELSGKYNEVHLAAGKNVDFIQGTIEKLVVSKEGSKLTVGQDAVLVELVQNRPITVVGQGIVGDSQIGKGEVPNLSSAGIYINGEYVDLPLNGDSVVINIEEISRRFAASDSLDGFEFSATKNNCSITSMNGSIKTNTFYSIHELENQLGIIREAALSAGISPILAIDELLGSNNNTITIGGLLQKYEKCKELAGKIGYNLEDSYTFSRYLSSSSGEGRNIYITLRLK